MNSLHFYTFYKFVPFFTCHHMCRLKFGQWFLLTVYRALGNWNRMSNFSLEYLITTVFHICYHGTTFHRMNAYAIEARCDWIFFYCIVGVFSHVDFSTRNLRNKNNLENDNFKHIFPVKNPLCFSFIFN